VAIGISLRERRNFFVLVQVSALIYGPVSATVQAGGPTARPPQLVRLQVPCGEGLGFARFPGRETSCVVDPTDYGPVIGAWTDDETVDLHSRFSCYEPQAMRQEDVQTAIDAAIESYLGLEPAGFAAWGSAASVQELKSAVIAIRVIAGLE
jgi:hypothetical protein